MVLSEELVPLTRVELIISMLTPMTLMLSCFYTYGDLSNSEQIAHIIHKTLGAILVSKFALAFYLLLKFSQKVKEPSIRKLISPDTISVMIS